jgi:hypothetical protein
VGENRVANHEAPALSPVAAHPPKVAFPVTQRAVGRRRGNWSSCPEDGPDEKIANAVCHALEAAKIRCWIAPRNVQPSADWGEAVVDAITRVRVIGTIDDGYRFISRGTHPNATTPPPIGVIPFRN